MVVLWHMTTLHNLDFPLPNNSRAGSSHSVPPSFPTFHFGNDDDSLPTKEYYSDLMAGESDGQYFLQIAKELGKNWTLHKEWMTHGPLKTKKLKKKMGNSLEVLLINMENAVNPLETTQIGTLDLMRRSTLSEKQLKTVEWCLLSLRVKNVPSPDVAEEVGKVLQATLGIKTIRYEGSLGNIYYVNDLGAIIAQELVNPLVWSYLRFMPELSILGISNAKHAHPWLTEVDDELPTPMVKVGHQDFYIFEPALTQNGVPVILFPFLY
ncbi:hypothetical protein M422DRAFT_52423 [Sphaerobolus stellatus SS14]|uniref:Uncharacterized protein n=1 Tax=Sphaerobolus stellatus (strain SS14) TaxID=990650 RepID=A0A0C9UFE4_SPHS4|nr:hypothetical protein M422DRAFT_52423 [Sphaerobolus stellatus SS14]